MTDQICRIVYYILYTAEMFLVGEAIFHDPEPHRAAEQMPSLFRHHRGIFVLRLDVPDLSHRYEYLLSVLLYGVF